ncbi:MAG TPA: SIMPL domain-containing protein [Longimicrobiales bacterium]|nr:SIMPL domain-containing protein [Longimicrobiales bacterium]
MRQVERWRLPLGVFLALSLGGCAALGTGGAQRTLTVTGEGHAIVVPDTATVTVGVQTTDSQVGPAVADNNATTERVIAAVQAVGVAPEDVQTTSFNVSAQVRYDEFGQPTEDVVYWVDNSVTITLRDIDLLDRLLNDALAAGANSIQSLTYGLGDPSSAQDQARQDALTRAEAQAGRLAADAGVTLGALQAVTESSGSAISGIRPGTEAGSADTTVPTAPGTLEVTVQVTATYGIR